VTVLADVNVPYKCFGLAIYTLQRAGVSKVGFISEPPPGPD
jgi:biopolymer transport protein ExbD